MGASIQEKYGPYTGWKLGLRQDWDRAYKKLAKQISLPTLTPVIDEENDAKIENVVEYRCDAGNGISSIYKDDRA